MDSAEAVARALADIRRTDTLSLKVSYFKADSLGYVVEFVPKSKYVLGGTWLMRVFRNGGTKVLQIGQ